MSEIENVEVGTDQEFSDTAAEILLAEVEAEEVLVAVEEEALVEKKPKKEKKVKPTKLEEPSEALTPGAIWWDEVGLTLLRRGYSQRNIVLRAAREAGKPFDVAMNALAKRDTIENKVKSLFS